MLKKTNAPPSLPYKLFISNYRLADASIWMEFLWACMLSSYYSHPTKQQANDFKILTQIIGFVMNGWLLNNIENVKKWKLTIHAVSWCIASPSTFNIYWYWRKTVACDFPWKIMLSLAGWLFLLLMFVVDINNYNISVFCMQNTTWCNLTPGL